MKITKDNIKEIVDSTIKNLLKEINNGQTKYTRDIIFNIIKSNNCVSREDFRRKAPAAYSAAKRYGWINEYPWPKSRVMGNEKNYIVYGYFDEGTNSVYVGLTNRPKSRHKEHSVGVIKKGVLKHSIVYIYFNSIGKKVPDPIILKDGLSAPEAQYYEDYYIELYRKDGRNVLNIAKAGSLGSYSKWTREDCIAAAKQNNCETWNDFRLRVPGAYAAVKRYKWEEDYTWFRDGTFKWSPELCHQEVIKNNCLSKQDFRNKCPQAYAAAKRHKWLDDSWFQKHKVKYNLENCIQIVKEKGYKTREEFRKNEPGAYNAAWKNGWLDKLGFQAYQKKQKWTMELCQQIVDSLKCTSRGDFYKKNATAYTAALRNGWLNQLKYFI